MVQNSANDGVNIANAGVHGVAVTTAGEYGLYVGNAGTDGVYISSADRHGLTVIQADQAGLYVGESGKDGIYINDAGLHGISIVNAAERGLSIQNAGGTGIHIEHVDGAGIAVWSVGGLAGYFNGDVQVTGSLTKGSGAFKIDHPLDPEGQYLSHSFVESPDMMNIYNGNVTLNAHGVAWVQLPAWFEALNRDFRYLLTPIGAPGPNLYVAQTISDNRFQIAGGEPGMEVSWQVTGIRHDPYAEAHRIVVEEEKAPEDQGRYLHPEEWGEPLDMGIVFDQESKEAIQQ